MTHDVVIIIPDTTPLIHLAAGNLLDVLPAMGRVVVPDVVALEATHKLAKPWAPEVSAWFKAAAVEIVATDIGELFRLALDTGRRPPRNAGELSIVEWLRDDLAGRQSPALVVYEDPLVPTLVLGARFGVEVTALTTRRFLELAARRGIISSADEAWHSILSAAPTANPVSRHATRKPAP